MVSFTYLLQVAFYKFFCLWVLHRDVLQTCNVTLSFLFIFLFSNSTVVLLFKGNSLISILYGIFLSVSCARQLHEIFGLFIYSRLSRKLFCLTQPTSNAVLGSKISRSFFATNQKAKKTVKISGSLSRFPSAFYKLYKSHNGCCEIQKLFLNLFQVFLFLF